MKNYVRLFITIFIVAVLAVPTFAQTAVMPSGSGTSIDPYQIATLNNLYWVTQNSSSWGSYFIQTADINASSSSTWASGAGFSPIGNTSTNFTGSYDGQTYRITGLFINRSSTLLIGFFGCANGATITNIRLENVNITGSYDVGGMIGEQFFSSATNCYCSGSVTVETTSGGGLIGYQYESTASNCYSTGTVTGGNYIGGLIGYQASNSSVTNCYSTDSLSGGLSGGLIGYQSNNSIATNCYSTGHANGGGLIGYQESGGVVTNCFWDMTASRQTSSAGGTGKSIADMKTASTFLNVGWSSSIWNIGDGINNGYPYLKWQNPGGTPLPVELTSFTATAASNSATLSWKTATEVNNYGFEVERRLVSTDLSQPSPQRGGQGWGQIGFVTGNGTSSSTHSYSYKDASVSSGTYAYRLKQIDNGGTYKYSSEAEVTIAVPKVFALNQNYPNPFNPTTTITYNIPAVGTQHAVSLRVYDIMGREVATLVNETKEAGSYQATFNASKLASGVYFYRLQSGSYASVKKLVLMK